MGITNTLGTVVTIITPAVVGAVTNENVRMIYCYIMLQICADD